LIRIFFAYLLVVIGGLGYCRAQECKLSLLITVFDDHSKEPLEGASLLGEGKEKVWFTEKDGKVLVTGLCPGVYRFTISHVGCEPRQIQINLNTSTAREVSLHHVKVSGKEKPRYAKTSVAPGFLQGGD
jgi:iron complex outermembrane recepter protein